MLIVTKQMTNACRILKPFTTLAKGDNLAKEPAFACVHFDGKVARATNGHVYAQTPCDSEGFVGYLPASLTSKFEGMVIGEKSVNSIVRRGLFTHIFPFEGGTKTLEIRNEFSTFLRRDWAGFISNILVPEGQRNMVFTRGVVEANTVEVVKPNGFCFEIVTSHLIRINEPEIEEPCSVFFSPDYINRIFTAGKSNLMTLRLQDRPDRLSAGFICGKVTGVIMPIRADKKLVEAIEELKVEKVSDTVVKAIVDDVVTNGYSSLKEEVKETVKANGSMVIDPSDLYSKTMKIRYILHCNECGKNESQVATLDQINELRALIECDRESCECGACDLEVRPMPRKRTSN